MATKEHPHPDSMRTLLDPNRYLYITEDGLRALDDYKYSGHDGSICSELFMQAYWTWLAKYIPRNLAPNVITLIGFGLNIFTFVLTWIYCPEYENWLPGWLCAWGGISLFIYQTLDALDGKQARNTKSGSPLGELFDHGCDALSVTFIALGFIMAIGDRGASWWNAGMALMLLTGMYSAQFEQYATGTLNFGKISAVTEGILGNVLLLLIAGAIGPDKFAYKIITIAGVTLTPFRLIFLATLLAAVAPGGGMWLNVVHSMTRHRPGITLAHRLCHVGIFLLCFLCAVAFVHRNPAALTTHFNIAMCVYGLIVANIISRMAVYRMCAMECPHSTSLFYVVAMPIVTFVVPASWTPLACWLTAGGLAISYMHLALAVCWQMSTHLKIPILHLPERCLQKKE